MYGTHRVAVVIPARNESRLIGKVLATIPPFVDQIIVVDDASDDDTGEVARGCGDPRVVVLRTPRNAGVGGAMRLGYARALEDEPDVVVKMDGDAQMPPEYLGALLDPIAGGRCDYAKGNRFLDRPAARAMPRVRLLGNIALTFMTKLASGYWHIFDPQNGYTAITAHSLKRLPVNGIHPGFFFENDMLCQLNILGFRVVDVPIPAVYGDEDSALNPLKASVTFPVLLTHRFLRRLFAKYVVRDFSPIGLFFFLGLLLWAWGAGCGLYFWVKSNVTGVPTPTGFIMLSVLPLILGFQLLLQAIVLDIQESSK
jgi:dolichol-phosphate mannosyltransferase